MLAQFQQAGFFPSLLAVPIVLVTVGGSHAEPSLESARKLLLTGRYDESLQAYVSLAKSNSEASAIGVARNHMAVGRYDEARQVLAAAARQHPQSAQLRAELAAWTFRRGEYTKAQTYVKEALGRDKNQLTARWVQAELHRVHGRLDDAQRAYEWFVDYYNNANEIQDAHALHLIGMAAAQYARWTRNSQQFHFLVNELYPDAIALDETYWPAHLQAGLLFLEKYNKADATDEFSAALRINPNAAEVHAARAVLALQNFELEKARLAISRARQIHPRLVQTDWAECDMALLDLQLDDARRAVERARLWNPCDERTLGRLAAVYGALDGLQKGPQEGRMESLILETTKQNKHCGVFYLSLGQSLEQMCKFPHAATYYQEAIRRMPRLVGPRARLGLMYMRLGQETKAATMLQDAFRIDPFHVRVQNSLQVLEVLQDYAIMETDHFIIKFDRGQDDILVRFVARYLEEEVYEPVVTRMGFAPPEKTLIEIFHRARGTSGHGWFSARVAGIPNVGTVAACAGKVVAMASPNDIRKKYNWARVLKHEFVHVVNLQQTDFHIPHWYTEGLAVSIEGYTRPPEWTRLLASRLKADKLFRLDTINRGFIRPSNHDDWTLAYCQAQLYVEYLSDTYGNEVTTRLLEAFGKGLNLGDALDRGTGTSQEEIEKGYRQYLEKIVSGLGHSIQQRAPQFAELQDAVEKDSQNATLLAQLAHANLLRNDRQKARRLALAAREVESRQPLAAYVMARLHLAAGDAQQAGAVLEEGLDEQAPHEKLLALLAGLKLKSKDFTAAARLYDLGAQHFPHAEKWLKAQTRVFLLSGEKNRLVESLKALAPYDTDDLKVRQKLANLALERKDYVQAASWANQALWIDVLDADIHALRAQALTELEDYLPAIEHFELAVRLQPDQNAWRFALADCCVQADRLDKTQSTLKELLERDPNFPGAELLWESLHPKANIARGTPQE